MMKKLPRRANPSTAAMDTVLGFIPRLEARDLDVGEWEESPRTTPSIMVLPYFSESEVVRQLREALYAGGFVLNFDWPAWCAKTDRNPIQIETATLGDVCRMLTTHARADRFSEGHFASFVRTGEALQILRRLAVLRARRASRAELLGRER